MKVVVILFAAVFGRNFQFFQNRDNSGQNDTEKQNIFHPRAAGQRWLQRIGLQLGIFKTQLEGNVKEKKFSSHFLKQLENNAEFTSYLDIFPSFLAL